MAEYSEQSIKFGWLYKEEIEQAIASQDLNAYDIVFTKDSHEQFLISSSLEPIPIKSRVRIFSSVDTAIEEINKTSSTYNGEIVSIRDGEKFVAYVVNQFNSGQYYISPIYSDEMIDYNQLQNVPLKNIEGTVTNPIVLADLEDGFYKVSGHFIVPTGNEVTSIVGNIIVIESFSLTEKTIKRISNNSIFDYILKDDGTYTFQKYATEQYVQEQGYVTEVDVDIKLEAFKASMEEYIENYVDKTVSLLIKYMITQELATRYSTEQDIQDLFE